MVVDTDILIDYLRGFPGAVEYLERNVENVCISAVSVAELYQGVREGIERTALRSMTSAVTVLAMNEEIAEIAGLYRRDFGKQYGCGLADCMIAATANFHELGLVTGNARHFGMLGNVIVPYVKNEPLSAPDIEPPL